MKKVLSIVQNNFTNDRRVLQVCRTIALNGHNVTLVAAKSVRNLPLTEKSEFKVIRIPLFSSLYSKKIYSKIEKDSILVNSQTKRMQFFNKIKNNKFRHILVSFLNWASFNLGVLIIGITIRPKLVYCNDLNTLTVGFIIAKIFNSRIIYDSHEIWLSGGNFYNSTLIRQKMWIFIEKNLIRKVDLVFATTAMRADFIERKYLIKNVEVLRNTPAYVEIQNRFELKNEFAIPKTATTFIYCGSITKQRGVFTILDVFENIPGAYLLYIGMGNDTTELAGQIFKKGLEKRVFLKEAISPNKLIEYISSADVGLQLLPNINFNHYSTISNKLLEYIMAECAVIASDFPEIRNIVENNNIGIVVDPSDREAIASSCRFMIENPQKLEIYKKNAKNIKAQYSWEKEKIKLLKIISSWDKYV